MGGGLLSDPKAFEAHMTEIAQKDLIERWRARVEIELRRHSLAGSILDSFIRNTHSPLVTLTLTITNNSRPRGLEVINEWMVSDLDFRTFCTTKLIKAQSAVPRADQPTEDYLFWLNLRTAFDEWILSNADP